MTRPEKRRIRREGGAASGSYSHKGGTVDDKGLKVGDRVGHALWPEWRGTVAKLFDTTSTMVAIEWDWSSHGTRVEFVLDIVPLAGE